MENQPAPAENFLNTTLLMTTSAGFVGLIGVAVSLFPEELLRSLGTQSEGVPVLLIRLVGALYLGFAVLNWMARDNLIGGIYSRPVALGNFAHFFAASIVLIKHLTATPHLLPFAILAGANTLFAVGFGFATFSEGQSCG